MSDVAETVHDGKTQLPLCSLIFGPRRPYSAVRAKPMRCIDVGFVIADMALFYTDGDQATMADRPYTAVIDRLRDAGLRPTRQRLALARLLFDRGDRHVTAEQLHGEAIATGVSVSLATVYNTLHQFTESGLLHEVVVEAGRSYFDTNVTSHHHFFETGSGRLIDIPADQVTIGALPAAPDGAEIEQVDLIIRVRQRA